MVGPFILQVKKLSTEKLDILTKDQAATKCQSLD